MPERHTVSLFDTGSLAKNVAVNDAHVRPLSFDAAVKYRGMGTVDRYA